MWTLDHDAAVPAWRHDAAPGLRLAFSTRRGGVSRPPYDTLNLGRSTADREAAVAGNRRRLLESLGLDPARLATAGQVHGATVTRVDSPGLASACDALLTTRKGLVLAVTAADCLPLLLETEGAVAAVHAGGRGAAGGVAEAAVRALTEVTGRAPGTITAHFGPCIRACCYEVGPEVAARFPEAALRRRGPDEPPEKPAIRLSVPDAVRLRLLEAGLDHASIHDTGACTACEPSWYFSHRRDRGLTGRHWGVIARI